MIFMKLLQSAKLISYALCCNNSWWGEPAVPPVPQAPADPAGHHLGLISYALCFNNSWLGEPAVSPVSKAPADPAGHHLGLISNALCFNSWWGEPAVSPVSKAPADPAGHYLGRVQPDAAVPLHGAGQPQEVSRLLPPAHLNPSGQILRGGVSLVYSMVPVPFECGGRGECY